ncbi:MAG: alpha-glucosidase/alpha-galactosidase [Spirochaetes bacterium]|nr:alpha-glucosidase/alpha-galactosidase [Spirochaetota bacterium]
MQNNISRAVNTNSAVNNSRASNEGRTANAGRVLAELKIAYIGGGSLGWAWTLMGDLASEAGLGGKVSLYDIERPAAETNARIGNALTARPDAPGKWVYEVAGDLASALEGADLVVASILPGTFDEMASDVHAPESLGVWQAVGDTTGPGGVLRALRTIPMYEVIAEAVRDNCPKAWVINYTNPMALCVRTLYATFPGIKAFGCCHEVFGTRRLLAQVAAAKLGKSDASMDDVEVNVLGVNHFTWLDAASFRGADLFPAYRDFVEEHFEEGFEGTEHGGWLNSHFDSGERVKFDLFRRYGLIAAAGDRHLAEFMPGSFYLADPETAKSWKFSLTPVSWRVQNANTLRAKAARLASGKESFQIGQSGEEGVRQIKALLGLGSFVTNVNLPNQGQIAGLPEGAVVETNAYFSADSVRPVQAGRLPPAIEALMAPHALAQETILRAAFARDAWAAFPAFLADPLMRARPADAEALYARMLEATKAFLPGYTL